jgi:hypothetical protein
LTRLHRFELRLAVIAMVALVIAQTGAIAHAYSHDTAVGSTPTHLIGVVSHGPCGDCLAYAPLLSVAGASGSLPFLESQPRDAVARALPDSLVDGLPLLAFRSRAPPYTP